ncbi:g522 [Yersinia phage fHe-Yen9-04]|uniref:G522 protein n=1 Tax=Yersinia phage fHe-Yen9-04 TaxID=2052742 RepID=A0A2C9CXZ1_9CAUD|nr:membrane protein [Yersinia phage fHe-Yen9-04]SOK58799.1 g522 [Yersinia phage fHe-Yen9-04]VUE36568.1 g522 [Yersinia phage fHe-Yen9-04]
MIELITNSYKVLTEYPNIVSIPLYLSTLFVGLVIIGWYFSTDYYDEIENFIECDGVEFIIFNVIILATNYIIIYNHGLSNIVNIIFNFILFIAVVLPLIISWLNCYRLHIRNKRGKL